MMNAPLFARSSLRLSILLATIAAGATSPLSGQQGQASPSRVTGAIGLDLASRYTFRGYELDARGAVFQPSVAVDYALVSRTSGPVKGLTAGATAWSSLHANTRAYPGDLGWFEVDLGLFVSAALSNGWTTDLVYTSYLAPDGAFDEVHELGLALQVGELDVGGALTVAPRVLVAQELHHRAGNEDTYLELGSDIALPVTQFVRWTMPLTLGMSLNDFYEDESGNNQWFGFFGSGLEAAADLQALGLSQASSSLLVAVDFTAVNRDAALSQDPLNDIRWTARAGLSFGF